MGFYSEQQVEQQNKRKTYGKKPPRTASGTPVKRDLLTDDMLPAMLVLSKAVLTQGQYLAASGAGAGGVLAITIKKGAVWTMKAYVKTPADMQRLTEKWKELEFGGTYDKVSGEQIYLTVGQDTMTRYTAPSWPPGSLLPSL